MITISGTKDELERLRVQIKQINACIFGESIIPGCEAALAGSATVREREDTYCGDCIDNHISWQATDDESGDVLCRTCRYGEADDDGHMWCCHEYPEGTPYRCRVEDMNIHKLCMWYERRSKASAQ